MFCLTAFGGPPIDRIGIPALPSGTPRRLPSAVVYPNVAKAHFPAYQCVCRYDWDAVVNDLAREDPRQSIMQQLLYDDGQPARFSRSLDARGSSGSTFHWCCGRNCILEVLYHQHAAESDMFLSTTGNSIISHSGRATAISRQNQALSGQRVSLPYADVSHLDATSAPFSSPLALA